MFIISISLFSLSLFRSILIVVHRFKYIIS
nr:MAG TPA: hypothetical protein [Caudoviricetes sp.]